MNHHTLVLETEQKIMLALQNSALANETNAALIKEWYQQVYLSGIDQFQNFALQSTHQGKRLTLRHMGTAKEVLKKYAGYYQDKLKVSTQALQRLVDLGIDWQPSRLGAWLELNERRCNAGWFVPEQVPLDKLLQTFDPNDHKRRLLSRWVNLCPEVACLGYGESLSAPAIQQIALMPDPATEISSQYYQALHLAELLRVPTFPSFLLEVLEIYHVQQLVISLWATRQEVLKFGVRLLHPSNDLLLALCMLANCEEGDEAALARIYGISGQVQWVELQQTSGGLVAEISFEV
jgi:hypothetical protein